MRRLIAILAVLFLPAIAGAQQLVDCAPSVPCTNGLPANTGTGDTLPVAGSKINANAIATAASIATLTSQQSAIQNTQTTQGAQILGLQSLTTLLPTSNGGTGATSLASAYIPTFAGSTNVAGHCVLWLTTVTIGDAGTSCGGGGGGGNVLFNNVQTGTNTGQTLTVGANSTLTTAGSGAIYATNLQAFSGLPNMPANTILVNTQSGAAPPTAQTLAAVGIPLYTSTPPVAGDCTKWLNPTTLGDAGAPCGSGSGGGGAFSAITSGVNTGAAMVVGSGAQLSTTGSGTIAATSLSTLAGLPNIANNTVLANVSGSSAPASAQTALLIPSGMSGGVLSFTGATTLASSGLLIAGAPVAGGGAGAAPNTNLVSGTGATNGVLTVVADVETVSAYLAGAEGGIGQALNPGATSNTSIGYQSMSGSTVTSGTFNTVYGSSALNDNTTGSGNTAIGSSAIGFSTTGGANTAVGYEALQNPSSSPNTASYNTGVGATALQNTQGSATYNTALGYAAGSTNTTGSYNTLIGPNCAASSATTTHEFDLCDATGGVLMRITGGGTPATSVVTFAGGISSGGTTTFTLGTGTGSCATTSTLVGVTLVGKFTCTGTGGAFTQVINLSTAADGWACSGSDLSSGTAWAQVASTTTTCTIAGAAANGDVLVFQAQAF